LAKVKRTIDPLVCDGSRSVDGARLTSLSFAGGPDGAGDLHVYRVGAWTGGLVIGNRRPALLGRDDVDRIVDMQRRAALRVSDDASGRPRCCPSAADVRGVTAIAVYCEGVT